MLDAFLRRSVDVPLDLLLELDQPMDNVLVSMLMHQAHRVESLRVRSFNFASRGATVQPVQQMADHLGPMLTNLSVSSDEAEVWISPSVIMLKSLCAEGSLVYPRSTLHHLTDLELREQVSCDSGEDLCTYLSTLLQLCPNVENFTVVGMAWIHAHTPLSFATGFVPFEVPLSRLRHFTLRDNSDLLPAMMDFFEVAPSVSRHLEAISSSWKDWDGIDDDRPFRDMFLHRLIDQAAPGSILQLHKLVLTLGAEDHVARLAAFPSSNPHPQKSVSILEDPEFNRVLDFSRLSFVILTDLAGLWTHVQPHCLEIHVSPPFGVTQQCWTLLIHAYPDLQSLSIGTTAAINGFISVFHDPTAFPQLIDLTLCVCDPRDVELEELMDCLSTRVTAGDTLRLTLHLPPGDADDGPYLPSVPPYIILDVRRVPCSTCHQRCKYN